MAKKTVRRPTENAALARIRRQAQRLKLSETLYLRYCKTYGEIIQQNGRVDSQRLQHAQDLQLAGMGV